MKTKQKDLINGYNHIRTEADQNAIEQGYYFDQVAANKPVAFIEKFCNLPNGKPFKLHQFQKEILYQMFGWRHPDGHRRFFHVHLSMGRGNGKTTFSAAIVCYLLYGFKAPGREIVSVAGDTDQANLCFNACKNMVLANEALALNSTPYRREIKTKNKCIYRVKSSDANLAQGLTPHVVIFDELHVQKNRELFDAMILGLSKTPQKDSPLLISCTTAGADKESVCYEVHSQAKQILNGIDSTTFNFLPFVYDLDDNEDWQDDTLWEKANPLLTPDRKQVLLRELDKARKQPSYQSSFRRYVCNQWVDVNNQWLNTLDIKKCVVDYTEEDLEGEICTGGVDMSLCNDLTASVLLFPPSPKHPKYRVIVRAYLPLDIISDKTRMDGYPYLQWYEQGFLKSCPGKTIQNDTILEDYLSLAKKYKIHKTGFDRNKANELITKFEDMGLDAVAVNQAKYSFNSATRRLEKLIVGGEIEFQRHPILLWNLMNVCVKEDNAGNIKPEKESNKKKIDLVVALCQALDVYIREEGIINDNREETLDSLFDLLSGQKFSF